jgi:hypothetical protein
MALENNSVHLERKTAEADAATSQQRDRMMPIDRLRSHIKFQNRTAVVLAGTTLIGLVEALRNWKLFMQVLFASLRRQPPAHGRLTEGFSGPGLCDVPELVESGHITVLAGYSVEAASRGSVDGRHLVGQLLHSKLLPAAVNAGVLVRSRITPAPEAHGTLRRLGRVLRIV